MSPTIIYILKVNVAISLMYLLYVALLKRDTFFKLRRYYLLFAIAFSFLMPFISINSLGNIWMSFQPNKRADVEVSVMVGEPTFSMIVEDVDSDASVINWHSIASITFIVVSLFLLFRFIAQLISIYRIWRRSYKQKLLGVDVYVVESDINPFSFFSLIFINNQKHTDEELNQILLHEQTHAKQWHSIDNIIITTINIIFWWNPFVWLIKREMVINLEHLADNRVLDKGVDISDYQYHLLKLTYYETAAHLGNNFNVSQLKQRIIMMNKSKTPVRKLTKYLSVIPLLLLLISVNSINAAQNVVEMEEINTDNNELQNPPPARRNVHVDEVFVVVEESPQFPGGSGAMMKYIADNLKYPAEAIKKGVQGRVICNMVILEDGSIVNVEVERGVDPLVDAEAVRVLETMPNWIPGKQRGNAVNVRYTLPVVFRLSSNDHGMLKFDVADDMKEVVIITDVNSDSKDDTFDELTLPVEEAPQFPGGTDALMKYLGDNIVYPVSAQMNGVQGRVICSMLIGKDGSISDVQVVRGVDSSIDNEAVRVIESMPNWIPGKQRGNAVNVRWTFPVDFRMSEKESGDIVKAEFPGGNDALMKYFGESINYPVIAIENEVQGLVKVIYRVYENGKAEVTDFSGEDVLVKEVKRLIGSMPKWRPANRDGKAIGSAQMAAFVFRLQGDEGSNFKSYDGEMPENAVVVVGYAKSKK